MGATVTQLAPVCPNSSAHKLGRSAHPWLLHLEGHVEEMLAEADDAKLLERVSHAHELAISALQKARELREKAEDFKAAMEANHLLDRVANVLHILGVETLKRAQRLREVIVPEVQQCYAQGEAFYEAVVR